MFERLEEATLTHHEEMRALSDALGLPASTPEEDAVRLMDWLEGRRQTRRHKDDLLQCELERQRIATRDASARGIIRNALVAGFAAAVVLGLFGVVEPPLSLHDIVDALRSLGGGNELAPSPENLPGG